MGNHLSIQHQKIQMNQYSVVVCTNNNQTPKFHDREYFSPADTSPCRMATEWLYRTAGVPGKWRAENMGWPYE
jgi:hypothetical protein